MKKLISVAVAVLMAASLFVGCAKGKKNGAIKIGIINNPPSESGYRAANVKDMEEVFSAAKGYEVKTFYSLKNDEQLNAASQFITEGVDYILLSPLLQTDGMQFLRMLRRLESRYSSLTV